MKVVQRTGRKVRTGDTNQKWQAFTGSLAFTICLALTGCSDDAPPKAGKSECPPLSGIPINDRVPMPDVRDYEAFRCESIDRDAQAKKERQSREDRFAAEAARVSERTGGGPVIALDSLPAHRGGTLRQILLSHGLEIVHVSAQEAKPAVMPGTVPGDVLMTLELVGKAKGLACGLNDYVGSPSAASGPFIAEVLYRDGAQVLDERTDPLMYWAATGKCAPG